MHYKETTYGFEYASAEVNRVTSDDDKGWVVLSVKSPKHDVQLYVTKTGKIRIWKDNVELVEKVK